MKFRKDAGKIKTDPTKSKMDNFIDEVVDMHKAAYTEVKGLVATHFDDVEDFDGLKSKVGSLLEGFTTEAEALIASLKNKWMTEGAGVRAKVEALYEEKSELLEKAKEKWSTFADVAHDTLMSWIDEVKSKLTEAHALAKSKLETAPKKSPAKKPVAKKPVTKTPEA